MPTTFSQRLAELAERFKRIDATDDIQGSKYVHRIAALAAKLVAECQSQSHFAWLNTAKLLPWPPSPAPEDEVMEKWLAICKQVAQQFQSRFTVDVGAKTGLKCFEGGELRPGEYFPTLTLSQQKNADWRQRAEDYAAVCNIFAQLTEGAGVAVSTDLPKRPDAELTDLVSRANLVMSESAIQITEVANSGQSAEEKMRRIVAIDATYFAWKSPAWSRLLRVRPAAIRKTGFWKIERKKHFADATALWQSRNPEQELPDELKHWDAE